MLIHYVAIGKLEVPIVNPADKYAEKADAMHKYGAYILSCLPKYVQQFSVWKDELTIYIPPAGVIPVFTFLKYGPPQLLLHSLLLVETGNANEHFTGTTQLQNSQQSPTLRQLISHQETRGLKWFIICSVCDTTRGYG